MIVSKLDIGLINQKLKQYGLPVTGTAEERAAALQFWYGEQDGTRLVVCDQCDMLSDVAEKACPFCGDASEIDLSDPEPGLRSEATLDIVEAAPAVAMPHEHHCAADLDRIVEVIGSNARVAAQSIYKIGQLLHLVNEQQLWRLRVDALGNERYSGFYAWAENEIGYKHAYTHRLMRVAQAFSEQDVDEFGITGLSMGLRVPEERRREFIARARQLGGPNNREMRSLANTMIEPVDEEAPRERPVVDYSTVPTELRMGLTVVEMKKKTPRHAPANASGGPARSIADLPWFDLKLTPDVWLAVRVFPHAETGVLQATVELRGVEDEEYNALLKAVPRG